MANHPKVLKSMRSSAMCDILNLRLPVPVWFARSRSAACTFSRFVKKRADGMSFSRRQYTTGAEAMVRSPTTRKILQGQLVD